MPVYFKIGEIAEMFDLSIRALHLYDKMGLFVPEFTDESTGYRYYTADQMPKLNAIVSFKRVGFSLAEIRQLYDSNMNAAKLLEMLDKKINYFQNQIDIANFNIDNLKQMINSIDESAKIKAKRELTEDEKALRMSKLVCLENIKLEKFLAEILWL